MTPARILVATLALLGTTSSARAQWLVVRAGVGDPTADERAVATAVRDGLRDDGVSLLEDGPAATTFSATVSRERAVLEADRIAELVDAVRVLEEHVAMRRREAALEAAEHIRELSAGVAEALEEQREVAQRLFDACIAEAWLHVQLGEGEAARTDLRRCRESYPDIAVDAHAMSSQVYDLIVEIDAELAARPAFQIQVTGAEAGCELSLDGRRRAVAPAAIEGVFAGEHRLEIECAGMRRTRIHAVLLGASDLTIEVDPAFDDALRTVGGVWLDYESAAHLTAHRVTDARELGRAVGATDVVLVAMGGSSVRLDRIDVGSGNLAASVTLALPIDAAAAARGLRAGDGAGRIEDVSPSGGRDDTGLVVGLTLLGVGVASIGAAWGTYAWRYELGQEVYEVAPGTPAHLDRIGARDAATPVPYTLGTIGSLAATISLPFFLPETSEFPWWSAIPAAAGAALLGVGIYQYTGDGRCVDLRNGCAQTYSTLLSGTLWLESSIPLLAVPIVYLFRLLVGPSTPVTSASASIDVTADHAIVTVGGIY